MQRDAHRPRHCFALLQQLFVESGRWQEALSSSVMKTRKRAYRVHRGVENQLRPLRAPSVRQWDNLQSGTIQQRRQLLNQRIGSARRLEWPDPQIAVELEPGMPGTTHVRGHRRRPSNYILHMLGDDFFVAQTVLH